MKIPDNIHPGEIPWEEFMKPLNMQGIRHVDISEIIAMNILTINLPTISHLRNASNI